MKHIVLRGIKIGIPVPYVIVKKISAIAVDVSEDGLNTGPTSMASNSACIATL
jgi:hypothetical protein